MGAIKYDDKLLDKKEGGFKVFLFFQRYEFEQFNEVLTSFVDAFDLYFLLFLYPL